MPHKRNVVARGLAVESLECRKLLAVDGLVSHWPFDHSTHDDGLHDFLGFNSGYVDSPRGRAISLRALGTPMTASLTGGLSRMTIAGWVKFDSDNPTATLIASPGNGFAIEVGDNQLKFSVGRPFNGQTEREEVASPFSFEADQWYHLAGSYDGERLAIYVGGDRIGQRLVEAPTVIVSGETLTLGSALTGPINTFDGLTDDLKLYARALNESEIELVANAESIIETSDDITYFNDANNPAIVDPEVVVTSESEELNSRGFHARVISPREGDTLSIIETENVFVEEGDVFVRLEGETVQVASLSTGSAHSVGMVFNADVSPAIAQTVIRRIGFTNTESEPDTSPRQVQMFFGLWSDIKQVALGEPSTGPLAIELPNVAIAHTPGENSLVGAGAEVQSNEPNFDGGTLTVRFIEESFRPGDRLVVVPNSTIARMSQNRIGYRSIGSPIAVIGTFTGGFNGNPLVISLNEQATPNRVESLARAVAYAGLTEEPATNDRFVRFTLADGEAEVSDVRKVEYENAPPVNQPPVIDKPDEATVFQEGDESVKLFAETITIVDSDSPNLDGGIIEVVQNAETIRPGDQLVLVPTDLLAFEDGNVLLRSGDDQILVATFLITNEGRRIRFEMNEASSDDAATFMVRSVGFVNQTDEPASVERVFSIEVTDGDGGSDVDSQRLEVAAVNDAPLIETSPGATEYAEGAPPRQVDSAIEVSDVDSEDFGNGSLRVSFAELSRKVGDQLLMLGTDAISVDGEVLRRRDDEQIVATFAVGEGVIEVDFAAGSTVDDVQRVARAVAFRSNAEQIDTAARFIRFALDDGEGGEASDIKQIEPFTVNDDPEIEVGPGATEYDLDGGPVIIAPQFEASDADSEDFGGGSLAVSFVEQSGKSSDSLSVIDGEGIRVEGDRVFLIEQSNAFLLGEIHLTDGEIQSMVISLANDTNAARLQVLARRIAFSATQSAVGDQERRFVRFTLNDGDGGEASDVRRVDLFDLNDDPVVEVADQATVIDLSESDSAVIAPLIEIVDEDSADFGAGKLLVSFVEQSGRETDSLAVAGADGILVDGDRVFAEIEGSENVLVGEIAGNRLELIIELTEHATPAIVERLARSITLTVDQDSPGEHPARFVRFEVHDGDGGSDADVKRVELVMTDNDADGVDNGEEGEAPFGGDGNQDGVPDAEQEHVASLRGRENRFITFSSPENTRLVNVQPLADPAGPPEATDFPLGLFDFQIEGIDGDQATVVVVHLEPGTTANTYYMFGPTPDNATPHWYPFLFDGQTGAKIFGDRIEVHFVDGERGDADLLANGVISDPGAPAVSQTPWKNPDITGDVNNDKRVSAQDALRIINDIGRFDSRDLPLLPTGSDQFASVFLDVSGDGRVSALDALRVINIMARITNAQSAASEFVSLQEDDDKTRWNEAVDDVVSELF